MISTPKADPMRLPHDRSYSLESLANTVNEFSGQLSARDIWCEVMNKEGEWCDRYECTRLLYNNPEGGCYWTGLKCQGVNMWGKNSRVACHSCRCGREDDNYGYPDHTSENDGSGPEFIRGSSSASSVGYMLGTGRVESYDLAEALIPGSQEFLDGVSGKAVPDPEGSQVYDSYTSVHEVWSGEQVHKIKYELQSWGGPINWGDLNRLVSDLAVQMRVASDSLIDHSAAAFGRYQTQITAGFFTITILCGATDKWARSLSEENNKHFSSSQPRYYGLNLTSGEQGFEPYMAPVIVSEDYFSDFASGNTIRREESIWDSLGNNWWDGRWYSADEATCATAF
ncbi:hypothetical protein E3Q24_04403 [Wallemia mellicola]|nr:hypothetical protein E3Q24_04403 [Wallemia mellicola]TIC49082.1 hypothetical protein E3Q04_04416 [Wallemia mellicola]